MRIGYLMQALLASMGLLSTPAIAWIEICNGRGDSATAAIAVAPKDPPGTSTGGHASASVEGWWKLAAGECATVSQANASQNWLYFHAHGKAGTLEGTARLCVRRKAFTSHQQFLMKGETCSGDWEEAGFVRRESSAKNFKFTIK